MIKKIIFTICFSIIIISSLYSKPYGLRQTNKPFQFDGSGEINYNIINHEPFIQFLFIPEFTFKKINFGMGFYLPLELSNNNKIRSVEYNSYQGILSKIYYFQYGDLEKSPISFKLSEIEDYTLGHGLIINRYSNNLFFPEIRKLGTQINISASGIHFNGILGDVSTQSVAGGRLSVKLGELAKIQSDILKSLDVGVTSITDFNPKSQDIIRSENNYKHKIIRRRGSDRFLMVFGGDLSLTFLNNSYFIFGVHGEFAKINISGEGIGYGIQGTILPKILALNYKFQFRHFLNSFSPSYFNSFYDAFRYTKIDSIGSQTAKLGWYLEISRYFYENKLGIVIAYDEIFRGDYNPHLFFKIYAYGIPKRLNFTIRYDRFNLQKLSNFPDVE
ncbi:MAG: hypothetical protein OEV44_06475, partial [Spirochaetota bacterium]|nr:hypothetical protein [Spirochaetota bacterium]